MYWGELPILPLCRVYECLSIKDCLAASSCCKNWRYAFQFHRIERVQLTLKVNHENVEKNIFLSDIYCRNTKELKVILASSIDEYTRFTNTVLKRFCDSKHLVSITYVPTSEYSTFEKTHNKDFIQRVLLTPLLQLCELANLQGININGCSELTVHTPTILQAIRFPNFYKFLGLAKLRPTFSATPPLNSNLFNGFTSLQFLSLDYDHMSESLLVGIHNRMPSLRKLILNITKVPTQGFQDMTSSWLRLRVTEYITFTVTINCVRLPPDSLNDVNLHVLCEALPLETLRVLFCKSINMDILRKLIHYNDTLKELVWIDSIINSSLKNNSTVAEGRRRSSRRITRQQTPNPLVMMCWQCSLLEKIILHGYWHSAHDLLGMALLRGNSLQVLDVSALLPPTPTYRPMQPFAPARLSHEDLNSDGPYLTESFIQKIKSALGFSWLVPKWNNLHPSLRGDHLEGGASQIEEYIIDLMQRDIPTVEISSQTN